MSKLIKKVFKGIKKVFKAIKKVVKKVLKSKLFKIIATAAAVVFTAGMAVPGLMGTLSSAVGLGGAASTATSFSGLAGMSAGLGGSVSGLAGVGAAAGGISGAIGAVGSTIASSPGLAGSIISTGGQMLIGASKAKAEQKAYDRDAAELEENNSYQLKGVKERMAAVTAKAVSPYSKKEAKYYDPKEDEYKNVEQPNSETDAEKDRNI